MKILAILQNMWFKDPARMEKMFHGPGFNGDRQKFIRTWLFWSCLTGKRLKAAFGEDLCDEILWEEASPQIGAVSSAAFPADAHHIAEAIRIHKPELVLTFGKIAREGVALALPRLGNLRYVKVFNAPHPAARHATVCAELRAIAEQVKQIFNSQITGVPHGYQPTTDPRKHETIAGDASQNRTATARSVGTLRDSGTQSACEVGNVASAQSADGGTERHQGSRLASESSVNSGAGAANSCPVVAGVGGVAPSLFEGEVNRG